MSIRYIMKSLREGYSATAYRISEKHMMFYTRRICGLDFKTSWIQENVYILIWFDLGKYFFNISLMYLDWFINISYLVCLICNPRKKFNSPIMLISNSTCIILANSQQKSSLEIDLRLSCNLNTRNSYRVLSCNLLGYQVNLITCTISYRIIGSDTITIDRNEENI